LKYHNRVIVEMIVEMIDKVLMFIFHGFLGALLYILLVGYLRYSG